MSRFHKANALQFNALLIVAMVFFFEGSQKPLASAAVLTDETGSIF